MIFPEKINNITFEKFYEIVNSIENRIHFTDNIYESSNHGIDLYETNPIDDVLWNLIYATEKALHDEDNTLNYFALEIDFGTDYHKCEYDTGNGIIETPLRNVRELWLYFAMDNKVIDSEEYFKIIHTSENN